MILERGSLLNNRYRIVEILGQGGMGSVYRAVDENLGVEVAVKDNLFTTEEYARQFRREAIILATLRHPNLPRVTDHFIMNGLGQYLVMDYIEGEDLRQRMERVGLLPDDEVILIGAAVCDALTYLGERKPAIIHRDLKPGNVKITPNGQIFLVDFGLAKTLQGSQATTTGARAMTPGYSPPEQYGTARTDQRSDIFSLGATLYAALTGATPEDALARAMDQADLTPIRKLNPKVSRRLANVIERALQVRPDDRYQTAEEFKQALLGAGSTTLRRREGDFAVTPPPSGDGSIKPGQNGEKSPNLSAEAAFADRLIPPPGKSPSLLPISMPLLDDDPEPAKSRPRRNQRRRSCLLYLALLIALLLLGSTMIIRLNPGFRNGAYGLYFSTISAVLPDSAGAASVTPVYTPTQEQVAIVPSPTRRVTLTPTMLPTSTPQPTETPVPTPTQTPLPTVLGGGRGQIAFASNQDGITQIFVINADGTERRKITNLPEGACQPDWSPDGERLVFISPCTKNTDYYEDSAMYIVHADGEGLLPLPTISGGDYDPRWSPDGQYIVFTSLRNSGRPQLYVLNLGDNSVRAVSERFDTDFQAEWSLDGGEFVFITSRRGTKQIWLMGIDGKNQRQFSQNSNFFYTRPSFSPDGNSILFTRSVSEGGVPRVQVAPLNGDYVEYRVGTLPMQDAVYSPDGYWLAFEGWEAGSGHNIYIISATGAGLAAVTNDSVLDFDPDWRPLP